MEHGDRRAAETQPHRLDGVRYKVTAAMADKAAAMAKHSADVINLATARPNFETPAAIRQEAISALQGPRIHTEYSHSRGLLPLRRAVGEKLRTRNGIDYDPESEVLITAGVHEGLYLALQALVQDGDEVLLLDPSWVAYHGLVKLAGGEPVYAALTDEHRMDLAVLEGAVTPRTRALLMSNPGNPTGTVFRPHELEALAAFAEAHDLVVIVDEIYEYFLYDGARHVSLASLPGMRERTLTLNGCSKAYAMTGWRIAYAAGPEWLISRMLLIHQHLISAPCTFAQQGAIAAFTYASDSYHEIVEACRLRRDRLAALLGEVPGVRFRPPEGACFLYLSFDDLTLSGYEITDVFVQRAELLLSPGDAFGPSGYGRVRLSFASLDTSAVEEVVDRIRNALDHLYA